MVTLGKLRLEGRVTLGPMAGVTDFAFRRVCLRQGAALVTTEMVSARALVYHDEKTKALLYIPGDGHPCAAQLFGHEPEVLAEAAPMALEPMPASQANTILSRVLRSTSPPSAVDA